MRLINSDGQIVDARQKPASGASANRNKNSVVFNGVHTAVLTICAAICGGCVVVAWNAVDKQHEIGRRYSEDSMYTQDQYQKERNHVIELEARLHSLVDEVQEMKHVRR